MAVASHNVETSDTEPSPRILELGCGSNKHYPNSIGVDINSRSCADVIHDLDVFPYPFPDNSFDIVVCEHSLEHLSDVIRSVEEMHRLLRPGGLLKIEVPHFSNCHAFTDPTHKHYFTSCSLDYFVEGSRLAAYDYTSVRFTVRRKEIHLYKCEKLPGFVRRWVNRHLEFYERHLAFIMTGNVLIMELEAVK